MINKHKSNKIKENSNTVRHLNNGTDHRHSKSCCDQSSPARRTINEMLILFWSCHVLFSFRLTPQQLTDDIAVCGLWGGQWPVNLGLYWPTVLRIHWQSVVYSHTRPNIAESVSMPLLTHCPENPRAVCGLLAHKAQYCRKCIHAFTDPLC